MNRNIQEKINQLALGSEVGQAILAVMPAEYRGMILSRLGKNGIKGDLIYFSLRLCFWQNYPECSDKLVSTDDLLEVDELPSLYVDFIKSLEGDAMAAHVKKVKDDFEGYTLLGR